MVLGSDLRARAEERLLTGTFGETYATYCRRTARFVPGLY
jgi:protein-S-isoprenylcysteine O-methyltransferase Ste14